MVRFRIPSNRDFYFMHPFSLRRFMLVAMVASVAPLSSWSAPATAPDPATQLKAKEPVKRRLAINALVERKDPADAGNFTEALQDHDAIVRQLAVRGLKELHWTPAQSAIGTLLVQDPSFDVRLEAAQALKAFKDSATFPALLKGLKDPSESIRVICVEALADAPDPNVRTAVLAAAKDTAPEVRRTAMVSLAHTSDPTVVPVLTAALHDTDAAVRANAAQALSFFAKMNNPKELQGLLADPNEAVRASAARSLAQMGEIAGLEPALTLTKAVDRTARLLALDALGYYQDARAKVRLAEVAANDPDQFIRDGAKLSLKRMEVRKKP